ncbi:alpha/beta fold hydrolase [Falsiroseomonas oryzae]|uniref:alpha/beta fold hydrolase n=1 Tax=Falsiroseomonas oryzae TaxID=2766473 RepID=UPI0022EA33A1|nr:alpha/beta hydrolase [Roseomonas sp. MO-31]
MTARQHRLRYLLAGCFHGLAWTEWGPEDGPPVVCVHGLTRTGRDFDVLAKALAARGRRVLCPDLPGRGASDRLHDPQLYTPVSYVVALGHLLARLEEPVDWVGTSLGGICGMMVAAAAGHPLRRLVLNDIGSRVPSTAAERIAAYVKLPLAFEDIEALEAHLRLVHAPFGPLTDAQWRHLAESSARPLPDGRFGMHYDPGIAVPFEESATGPVDLSLVWSRVALPILLLRGAESDVLDAETAAEMAMRPGVQLVTLPGIGHAPALMDTGQIARVAEFLEGR